MKLYLVNPKFEPTIWSFEGLRPFTGTRFSTAPLGLVTIAALTPKQWDIEIADENVEDINYETDADLIGITAFNVQYQRALQIAEEFKARGKKIVFGGPYCTLFPEAFEGKGDYLVSGEAEHIWPEFMNDFEQGKARPLYKAADKKVNLTESPAPRYDLIRGHLYNNYCLQTSRGCPFQCEFCDIIVMDGRVPRTKTVEQILGEVDHCVELGAHYILFGDANFIGNIPFAKKLLKALVEYQKKNDYRVEFSCELTINVAHDPELLQLLNAANFYTIFIGIESPRKESLVETKKLQNTRRSMLDDIQRIQSHHITICAGMIVGFDSDDRLIFNEQLQYLKELGIPFTTCGTLMALPNTPLLHRLQKEGRMLNIDWSSLNGHGAADCNFKPMRMSIEDLRKGYNWLIRSLYRYDAYGERLVKELSQFQNRIPEHKRAALDSSLASLLGKVIVYYVFTTDFKRMKFFLSTFWKTVFRGPFSFGKVLEYFRWIAAHRAFREYVLNEHGDPETVCPNTPPFQTAISESFYAPSQEPAVSFGKNAE